MVAQVCGYTKNHGTVHFKGMVYELYINKAVAQIILEGFQTLASGRGNIWEKKSF